MTDHKAMPHPPFATPPRVTPAPCLDQTHAYDGLDRLILTQLGNPASGSYGYAYDLSGNRTAKTVNGTSSITHSTSTISNRLLNLAGAQVKSFVYDTAGNLITDGATATYGYDNAGRRTT